MRIKRTGSGADYGTSLNHGPRQTNEFQNILQQKKKKKLEKKNVQFLKKF
jgi:hypothetical protein